MELLEIYKDINLTNTALFTAEETRKITYSAKILVSRLQKICASPRLQECLEMDFLVQDDGTSVEISTPLGRARVNLVVGIVDQRILGIWEIRKSTLNGEGLPVFPLIGTVRITSTQDFQLGSNGALQSVHASTVRSVDEPGERLVHTILYAIGVYQS